MQNWKGKDRLSSLKMIIRYLDQSNQLNSIRKQCDDSPDQESPVYIFSIYVNLHELYEKSVLLAEKVLTSPVDTSHLFHEAIFEYIKCQNLLPSSISSSQVLAKLCITHLPCKSFQISCLSDLTKFSNYKGLVKLTGIVSGSSGLTKYTQSTRYICLDSNCDGHYGNHFIRVHIPGAFERQTVRSDFVCTFCGGILEEVISSRMISDKMVAEVLPVELKGDYRRESFRGQFTQAVPVIVRDELVNLIEIGKSYAVIGICRTDYFDEVIAITLEANSMSEMNAGVCTTLSVIKDIPNVIACILRGDIVPIGKMIKLRLLLLLSLVLYPQDSKLHILAIGGETEQALAVMTYATKFSLRFCTACSATPLNGKVVNDKYQWAPYFVQGGSQILSRGGICFFGEIGLWKKARKEQLKNALASNKVIIELAPKYTGSLAQTLSFPLGCQNWAIHETPGAKPRSASSSSDVFVGSSTGDLSKSFIDAFNIVAFLDGNLTSYDEESDLDFLDFMWREHCCDIEDEEMPNKIEADDFHKYLSVARGQEPKMTVEAEDLLHSYFSASRLARTSGCGGSDVPPSAMVALMSLSEGISKLQLHQDVTENDAELAIYLYEEYMTSRWGLSVLNVQPKPDVPSYEMENLLGRQADIMMQQFNTQLKQFCARVKDTVNFNRMMKSARGLVFKEE